jgi:hypothetical protein
MRTATTTPFQPLAGADLFTDESAASFIETTGTVTTTASAALVPFVPPRALEPHSNPPKAERWLSEEAESV